MDNEKESSDKFFLIISDLRKKWIYSLFRKKFGFEPTISIVLEGNAEKRFEVLAKMHQLKRVKWTLLNNKFSNTAKRIFLKNRFVNFFRKDESL
tara:strand:- start:442 stop:723 length:282 start_codon:yes stop_codon:yes gene_type:complete